jgi:Tfp pilus assembly protein PilO
VKSWTARLRVPFLVLVGVNAAVFLAFTLPRILQERSLQARAEALHADVALARQRAEAARQRAETLRQDETDTRQFFAEVVADRRQSLVPLLQEVVTTARELGLRTEHQSYDTEPLKGLPLVRFHITMPVTGSYAQLASLLDRLEKSRRFITVDQVALREEGNAGQAQLSLTLSAYFRSEAGE